MAIAGGGSGDNHFQIIAPLGKRVVLKTRIFYEDLTSVMGSLPRTRENKNTEFRQEPLFIIKVNGRPLLLRVKRSKEKPQVLQLNNEYRVRQILDELVRKRSVKDIVVLEERYHFKEY